MAAPAPAIPEILLSIASFLTPNEWFNLSLINVQSYQALLPLRLRDVSISHKGLWSFGQLLHNRKLARYCQSITIRPFSFGRFASADTKSYLYSLHLILSEIGDVSGEFTGIRALSVPFNLEGWFRQVSVSFKEDDPQHGIKPSDADWWSFEDVSKISGTGSSKAVARNSGGFDTRRKTHSQTSTWFELSRSAESLEELVLDISYKSWINFTSHRYNHLRRLSLSFDSPTIVRNIFVIHFDAQAFPRIEVLKLALDHLHVKGLLEASLPALTHLDLEGGSETWLNHCRSNLSTFLMRHPRLQTLSLGQDYCRMGLKFQHASQLTALEVQFPTRFSTGHDFPLLDETSNIRQFCAVNVGSALLDEFMTRVRARLVALEIVFEDYSTYPEIVDDGPSSAARSGPFSPRYNFAHGLSRQPDLKELSLICYTYMSLQQDSYNDITARILHKLAAMSKLRVVRIHVHIGAKFSSNYNPLKGLELSQDCIPKTLQYIVIWGDAYFHHYELSRSLESGESVKVARISPLRSLPLKGKWSVDWTDESFLDHFLPPDSLPAGPH